MELNPTLNPTKQAFYDGVCRHLLKQGERCMVGSVCRYRNKDLSMSCAIGQAIPDSKYVVEMDGDEHDGVPVQELVGSFPQVLPYLPEIPEDETGSDIAHRFLADCQDLHDRVDHWNEDGFTEIGKRDARDLAKKYNLVPYDFMVKG